MSSAPARSEAGTEPPPIEGINTITLATHDMTRAVRFGPPASL